MMDIARGHEQQEQAAHQLGESIEAFGDDPDLEDPVQRVFRFEHPYLPAERASLCDFLTIRLWDG
jgi:hypothetical protein